MSLQQAFSEVNTWLSTQVIGQEHLINRLLISLLADGHLLVEGAPGLAKTRAINMLSRSMEADFHRIQFTPDLLPGDITGTDIFRPNDNSFAFQEGPIFNNLILADEINRAPAKVQAALLEAMAERQVTIGKRSWPLPELFLVMATRNPIEQEGTYPLPEAQLDRFLMQVNVDYPNAEQEMQILNLVHQESQNPAATPPPSTLSQQQILSARQEVLSIHIADSLKEYIVQIVLATRHPERWDSSLAGLIDYGASPRATLALDRCARAHAWLNGRDFVTPDDIQVLCPEILRHRILPGFEAEAEGIDSDTLIQQILNLVPVP